MIGFVNHSGVSGSIVVASLLEILNAYRVGCLKKDVEKCRVEASE